VPEVWVLSNADGAAAPPCSVIQGTLSPYYHQYGPFDSKVPQYFGVFPDPAKHVTLKCENEEFGCLLSSAATMLPTFNSWAPNFVPDPTWLDAALKRSQGYDIGTYASLGITKVTECDTTAMQIKNAVNQAAEGVLLQLYNGGNQICPTGDCTATDATVEAYLQNQVCGLQNRVILNLDEFEGSLTNKIGQHFVFVTGKANSPAQDGGVDWSVFDPGWNASTIEGQTTDSIITSLDQHIQGFTTASGKLYFRVAGAQAFQETSNPSSLSVVANSPIELLVTDPQGLQLGRSSGSNSGVFEIPGASYLRDFPLADDTGGSASNGDPAGRKTAYIPSPQNGSYTVSTTGTGLGIYMLEFEATSEDGSIQSLTSQGIAAVGATSDYYLTYSSKPGAQFTVVRLTTPESALNDLNNSLNLNLIRNVWIADLLEFLLRSAAQLQARGNCLEARVVLQFFIDVVQSASGWAINPLAVQILSQDAQYLISSCT
jgi:hypothetical protein